MMYKKMKFKKSFTEAKQERADLGMMDAKPKKSERLKLKKARF